MWFFSECNKYMFGFFFQLQGSKVAALCWAWLQQCNYWWGKIRVDGLKLRLLPIFHRVPSLPTPLFLCTIPPPLFHILKNKHSLSTRALTAAWFPRKQFHGWLFSIWLFRLDYFEVSLTSCSTFIFRGRSQGFKVTTCHEEVKCNYMLSWEKLEQNHWQIHF